MDGKGVFDQINRSKFWIFKIVWRIKLNVIGTIFRLTI